MFLFCRLLTVLQSQSRAPKTQVLYLGSLLRFCDFLNGSVGIARRYGISNRAIAEASAACRDYSKSLARKVAEHEQQIKATIGDVILDREDVAKFILNIKNEAERVTNILEHNHATWNHVILLRNILMALLFLQGAPRSGVVSNMTVGEFLGSKEVLDGNLEIHKIVTVSHHKTRGTYGPQLVPLDKPLQRWMQIYYELGRPLTPALNGTQEEDPFFVGIGGLAVKKVAQELQRLWDRHDFTGKINPNIIRKTVATLNQGSNLQPSEKTGVSRLMGHLETTQKKYYTANQAPVEAIKYKRTIHQLLYENTPGGSANDSDPEQTKKLRKFSSKLFSHEQDITLLEEVNRLRALEEAKPGKSRNLKDLVRQMMSETPGLSIYTLIQVYDHMRRLVNCQES
ncbi:uncharacterized protein [Asterias amurensis]|uniref:uncharacterized protein n=1 Tax=Asterias amurensis TaxID=7602 RepID=UPI003AB7DBF1